MQIINGGDTITLYVSWYDEDGNLVDPPETTMNIVRSFTRTVYGPFSFSGETITQVSTGVYSAEVTFDDFLVPGNYTAKWEATIDGDVTIFAETVQLVEPEIESIGLTDPPRLVGKMRESNQYDVLGVGLTDTIFLVGHGDGIGINSPFRVENIQEAVDALGADINTPLLRGMLEAYNAGARDIWLVAAAPMSEYISHDPADDSARYVTRDEWGGENWYERYRTRLETTWDYLLEWEIIEYVVVLEAGLESGVNFFDDMVWNCYTRFKNTGFPSVGVMGTQMGAWSQDELDALLTVQPIAGVGSFQKDDFLDYIQATEGLDTRTEVEDNIPYKFGMIIFGEGTFTLPQVPRSYVNSPIAAVIGALSASPLNRGITYLNIPHMVSPVGNDLSYEQQQTLAQHRINPLIRKVAGKRGLPYKCVIATDNLFMPDGSDFWSVVAIRLVAKVIQEIKLLGNQAIGTIAYDTFKRQVEDLLKLITSNGSVRDYKLNIYRRPAYQDPNQTVLVSVGLTPYFGVRDLIFQVEVGPST